LGKSSSKSFVFADKGYPKSCQNGEKMSLLVCHFFLPCQPIPLSEVDWGWRVSWFDPEKLFKTNNLLAEPN